jgi:2-isopropylmalate synthase
MPSPNHIVFFDTTLRDGEQSPGCTMHNEEKLRLAHQIAALGVDVLEAGFAIASDGDLAAIQAVAREVRGPRIASLARCKREDIEAAARAVEAAPSNRIHLVLASSDLHLEYKLRITQVDGVHGQTIGDELLRYPFVVSAVCVETRDNNNGCVRLVVRTPRPKKYL